MGSLARRSMALPTPRVARRCHGHRRRPGDAGRRLGRGRRSEQLGAPGRRQPRPGDADLPQRADAVRRAGATCSGRQPHRRVPPGVHGADGVAWPADAAAGRRGELDGLRLGQRAVRRVRDRQPPRVHVRHHRSAPAWHQRRVHRRPALERVDLGRGSGPVVDARAAPQRRARVGAAGRVGRHGDVPGLEPDGTTGTLDVDVGLDVDIATAPGPVTVEVSVVDPSRRRSGAAHTLATTGRLDVPRWTPRDGGDAHALAYAWRGHRVRTRLRVPAIEPWNHETPRRYRAVIVLRDGDGTVLDVRARWVGFRRVEVGRPGPARQRRRGRDQRRQPPRHPP